MKKKIFFTIVFYLVSAPITKANYAKSYSKLSQDKQTIINKVNDYFDSINTFKSNFLQFNNSDSSMSEGMIYIEKPTKIRFEYTNPFRTLFIKNKNIINYYDIDLDELIVVPQSINPIFDIFSKQDNLKKLDSKILSVDYVEKNVSIGTELVVEDTKFRITYVFDREITKLVGLNVDNDGKIELSFFNTSLNQTFDKKTFVFDNPRLFNNKRKIKNK